MQVQREGKDVTLVAFGKLVGYNLKAAEILEKEGISCEVSMRARGWTSLPAAGVIRCRQIVLLQKYKGLQGHSIHSSVSCCCELLYSPSSTGTA